MATKNEQAQKPTALPSTGASAGPVLDVDVRMAIRWPTHGNTKRTGTKPTAQPSTRASAGPVQDGVAIMAIR